MLVGDTVARVLLDICLNDKKGKPEDVREDLRNIALSHRSIVEADLAELERKAVALRDALETTETGLGWRAK